jgi:hypothetical protein
MQEPGREAEISDSERVVETLLDLAVVLVWELKVGGL